MEFKKINKVSGDCLDALRGESSEGLAPNQWRLMPLHGDTHEFVTEWGIFQLDMDAPGTGDIEPVGNPILYWDGLEIVRVHNAAFGFYKGE